MNTNDKLGIFFGNLPQKMNQFGEYLHLGKNIRIFEGESIINNYFNEKDSFIFYIKRGRFKLTVTRADDSKLDFAYCGPGSTIQKNTAVDLFDICNPSDAIAVENSEVVSFTKQQLFEFMSQDESLFNEYIDNLSNYLLLLKQRTLITAGLTSSQRLLTWLNKLCSVSEMDGDGIYSVPCSLSQQQIADLLFIHVTTCNKLLGQLRNEGILKRTKKYIKFYKPERLQQYLDEDLKLMY